MKWTPKYPLLESYVPAFLWKPRHCEGCRERVWLMVAYRRRPDEYQELGVRWWCPPCIVVKMLQDDTRSKEYELAATAATAKMYAGIVRSSAGAP